MTRNYRNYRQEIARTIARKALDEGLRVFLAKDGEGEYGCFTDDGQRIVSFGTDLGVPRFSGCYKSKGNGTGWLMCEGLPSSLRALLSACSPYPCTRYTTATEFFELYQPSSKYKEMRREDLWDAIIAEELKPV